MIHGTCSDVTVTSRPRYAGHNDAYEDFLIVVNGTVIGGTGYDSVGTYCSWGLTRSVGHRTREAAGQTQVDAALAAGLDVLNIRIDTDAFYRAAIDGSEDRTHSGAVAQNHLDDAARCAAVITGTSDGFTIDHTAVQHHSRACEHDGQVVIYRPLSDGGPVAPGVAAPRPRAEPAMAYEEALAAGRVTGAGRVPDSQLMALFCADTLQTVVGAVAPRLVWEGARKRGMSTKQLAILCATDVIAVSDLMW